MKKGLLFFLLIIYLGAISGLEVALHYCHGHYQTISINTHPKEDACCSKKGSMKKSGCCHDKVIKSKIKCEQKAPVRADFSFQTDAVLAYLTCSSPMPDSYIVQSSAMIEMTHGPPDKGGTPVYILTRTFRI
jgi:hypothetical protein